MLKKIVIGFLILLLLAGSWVGWQIWSRYEAYPELQTAISQVPLEHSALGSTQKTALANLIDNYRERYHLPSVSLAIGLDGEMAFLGAVGFSDLAREERANAGSLYRIGSVSKAITAVALIGAQSSSTCGIDPYGSIPSGPTRWIVKRVSSESNHRISPLRMARGRAQPQAMRHPSRRSTTDWASRKCQAA